MSGRGRPLRFLGMVAGGWVGMRVVLLWPQAASLPDAIRQAVPFASARAAGAARAPPPLPVFATPSNPSAQARLRPAPSVIARPGSSWIEPDAASVQLALFGLVRYGAPVAAGWPQGGMAAPAAPLPDRLPPLERGWSASVWLLARAPGSAAGPIGGGQLGGSQAGVRLAYMLAPRARIALVGKVVAPLHARGREASLSLEWQPSRLPVRLVAEHRFGLEGIEGGPGGGVVAGIDAGLRGFRIEGYGQAGALRRARIEPYADGALRATRALGRGDVGLALGLGGWAAAQRGVHRLDLGPSATLSVPVAGTRLRLALDWRVHVSGQAGPGSGPALSLGGDF